MSLQEYMAFMISRETENVQSAREVEAAFRALTTGEKPYITANELFAVCVHSVSFGFYYFASVLFCLVLLQDYYSAYSATAFCWKLTNIQSLSPKGRVKTKHIETMH